MSSIGEMLREAREKKGISQEVAAKAVKIKVDRLRDLEENRYEHFAAHIYVRGFLRHYADYLGVNSDEILEKFTTENPPPAARPVFEITEDQRSQSPVESHIPGRVPMFSLTPTGQAVLATILVLLVVVGMAVWWVFYGQKLTSLENSNTFSRPESPAKVRPVESLPSEKTSFDVLGTNAVPVEIRHNP